MRAVIVWLRRDLRLADHPVLRRACADATSGGRPVTPAFVLDPALLASSGPNRLAHLFGCLRSLRSAGLPLVIRDGDPAVELARLAAETGSAEVRCTAETTPFGRRRDRRVAEALAARGVALVAADSPYAVPPGTVLTQAGTGYRVFTPFHRAWLPMARELAPTAALDPSAVAWADRVEPGVVPADPSGTARRLPEAGEPAAWARWEHFRSLHLADYATARNLPGADATSRLSVDLKFGVMHPRQLLPALRGAEPGDGAWVFRSELAWREFYADVVWHRPETTHSNVDRAMDRMQIDDGADADARFDAWCRGATGFPFIDAGMRQLLDEGWMHNRVRMAVASFLVKDLHLDWRRGAAWFMRHLVDGDIASNQHGWQWAAGTGTDAAPYFRIFNPTTQGRTHDPDGVYIRRHLPEIDASVGDVHDPWAQRTAGRRGPVSPAPSSAAETPSLFAEEPSSRSASSSYPRPIVDHAAERDEALRRYRELR